MKTLIIGCGGIGSNLIYELADLYKHYQLEVNIEIDIADADMVEMKQFRYQRFTKEELGDCKSSRLAQRFDIFEAIPERITKDKQLKGYDMIILCVDNEPTRDMVVRYCWKNNVEFIDLRASGSRIFAMPKAITLEDNLKFIDSKDKTEYSCQDKADLDKGWIQLGNRLIAVRGAQMFLNHIRGHTNRLYIDTI